ncbi:MAG: hypothetical protein IJ463_04400 [Bacilli bacterium]|nr:hypothetical protein [Bacilli bacterium]
MGFIKRNSKIFILSGTARSGKDTVAKIIKNYYREKDTIIISFGHYIKDYAKRVSDWDGSEETKPRELLQQLGIELIKNKINNKLFIKRILEDIEIFSYFYDIIVVDDARLVDEIETLKQNYKDAITIRVIRDNFDNGLTKEQKNHLTETNLDNYNDFDYIINNDEYLKEKVEDILSEV